MDCGGGESWRHTVSTEAEKNYAKYSLLYRRVGRGKNRVQRILEKRGPLCISRGPSKPGIDSVRVLMSQSSDNQKNTATEIKFE